MGIHSKRRMWVVAAIAAAGTGFLVAGVWLARLHGRAAGSVAIPGPVLAVAGSAGDLPQTGAEPLQPKLGIFRSLDTGWEWEHLPAGKSWKRVGEGLPQAEIYDAQWTGAGNRAKPQEATVSKTEPSVQQVQRVAMAYAEVGPEKIRRWRGLARWSAFVPSFTLGLNQDRDATIVSSTSAGLTKFTAGPDHNSRKVDFGFTWHLADFIWSPDQTSIDVRSRLTTQLRQEMLEEVTRLYFERKRLLAEFEAQPIEDPTLRKERGLRVQELTAYLDALTGGWFSEHLEPS